MDVPPRRVGKRLIGRFLFLRIALGTILLVFVTVYAAFWAERILSAEPYNLDPFSKASIDRVHSQASNTLTFGACFVTLSARFSYQNSISIKVFQNNKFVALSIILTAVLQVMITYIPGLNGIVFAMAPMYAFQWGIVFLGGIIVFIGLEAEKAFRRYLKAQKYDTDDAEYGFLDGAIPEADQDISLPKGASHLKLTEIKK